MKRILGATTLVFIFLVGAVGTASAEQVQLTASLSGDAEVGDPGDPGGTGSATVDIDTDTNEVCFVIVSSGTSEDPAAAHIHEGASDVAGGVVVDFDWATNGAGGGAAGCVAGDAAVVASIVADPSGFYVNVHTGAFPAGAIRGQLSAATGELAQTGTNLTLIILLAGVAFIAAGGMFYTAMARVRR